MVTLSLSWWGDQQVSRTLHRFAGAVVDMRPAFVEIRDRFLRVNRRQFATQGKHGSGGWAPLSPPYAAWKATQRPGAKILVFDGDLRRSLTEQPDYEVIEPHYMAVGSNVEHGRYHQHGTDNMPARPPVDLTDNWKREAMRVLQRHLVAHTDRGVA